MNIKLIKKRLKQHLGVLRAVILRHTIILNYQMGKVGSSSVAKFLRNSDDNYYEWNVHRFSDFPVHEFKRKHRFLKIIDLAVLTIILRFSKSLKVITGVREPILRDMSMFFHNYNTIYGLKLNAGMNEFLDSFRNEFPISMSELWFDQEFYKYLDIDVFSFPFDKMNGYTIIRKGKIEVFIYRMDKLSGLSMALKEFFDIPNYKIVNDNTANTKDYRDKYYLFKSSFPNNELRYTSQLRRFLEHFYTDKEIRKHKSIYYE